MREHKDQFDRLNTRIIVISFVTNKRVNHWQNETRSPFTLLLDPERRVYNLYGLKSSLWRSWQPAVLWYYVKQVLKGKPLHSIQGDPNQLGGDFIVAANGILHLAHYSNDPTDRPPSELLLNTLQEIS